MDIVSYILSRKYTNETAIQFGGLKGAPCKVKNISKDNGQTTVTFEWKNDDGETRESSFVVEDGLNNWVSGRSYEVGDIVNKDGSLYTCKTANSDTTFDYAKWSAVVGVELTQAQYDALPESQKMNGTIYFITDGIGNGGANLDYYSTEETKTNKVWIDGKPIYRKVYRCTSATSMTLGEDWKNIPGWDVDTSDKAVITFVFGSIKNWGRIDWVSLSNKLAWCCLNSTITVPIGAALTVEYTKEG